MNFVKKAVIAGGGYLPSIIIKSLQASNTPFFVIAIKNECILQFNPDVDHEWLDIGLVGKIIDSLKSNNITEIIFAGSIRRPALTSLKLDAEGLKLLSKITKSAFLGDNNILSKIIEFLEDKGFKVIGAEEITKEILTPIGVLGDTSPNKEDDTDIIVGKKIALAIGELDIGQAIIIEKGLVLGIEAVEGTDNLIKRCALLKREKERSGIVVKMKKPNQDHRIDLPSIGIDTIKNIANSGFSGVVLHAHHSIIIDKQTVINEANKLGIFITGIL